MDTDRIVYLYTFAVNGLDYLVYAPSKTAAIKKYLREKLLKQLPKGCTITRTNG